MGDRISELDGLRAIAILLVLGCHYEGFAILFGGLPQFGWLGVDIFFVLSGYLITSILLNLRGRPRAYRTFYMRRAVRILPPYVVATVAVLILGIILRHHEVFRLTYLRDQLLFLQAFDVRQGEFLMDLIRSPIRSASQAPHLLLRHDLPKGDVGIGLSIVAPSLTYWSLSIEEYFYIVWAPVVLKLPHRAIFCVGLATCICEALLRWLYADWTSYFGILFRFDALAYGALLAMLLAKWKRTSVPAWAPNALIGALFLSALGIAIILFAIGPVIGNEVRRSPLFRVFGLPLISIATAAMIGLLVVRARAVSWFARACRARFMQLIGSVSYTMYLLHVMVAYVVITVLNKIARVVPIGNLTSHGALLFEAFLCTLLTVLAAKLSWEILEKPLLRWKDSRFPREGAAGLKAQEVQFQEECGTGDPAVEASGH